MYDLKNITERLASGEISSIELTKEVLANAKKSSLGAYLTITEEVALEAAKQSDERRAAGKLLSGLDGVPMGLKDVFCTEGMRTTAASKMLEGFVPPYSATSWKRLEDAGVVLIGKLNLDEFAMGGSTERSALEITKNPWDAGRVPGGSSGGSAVAVAASEAVFSMGTDTGGSIRQPAAFCGVTGLKVSYGRTSRYGVIPMASSLDTIGPIASSAQGLAMILQVIAGQDPLDGTTVDKPVPDYTAEISQDIKGMKIGLPEEYFVDGIDPEVRSSIEEAVEVYRSLGAEVKKVALPHTKYAVPAYYIVCPAEVSANMARYDGVRFGLSVDGGVGLEEDYVASRDKGLGEEVKRRIMLGTYALSSGYYDAYYKRAQQVRTLIKQDFEEAFSQVDALITPATPGVAFRRGEKMDDPVQMYLEDIFTVPASLAGICGLSHPVRPSKEGLPIGLQLLGPALGEGVILKIAHQYQLNTDYHKLAPQ